MSASYQVVHHVDCPIYGSQQLTSVRGSTTSLPSVSDLNYARPVSVMLDDRASRILQQIQAEKARQAIQVQIELARQLIDAEQVEAIIRKRQRKAAAAAFSIAQSNKKTSKQLYELPRARYAAAKPLHLTKHILPASPTRNQSPLTTTSQAKPIQDNNMIFNSQEQKRRLKEIQQKTLSLKQMEAQQKRTAEQLKRMIDGLRAATAKKSVKENLVMKLNQNTQTQAQQSKPIRSMSLLFKSSVLSSTIYPDDTATTITEQQLRLINELKKENSQLKAETQQQSLKHKKMVVQLQQSKKLVQQLKKQSSLKDKNLLDLQSEAVREMTAIEEELERAKQQIYYLKATVTSLNNCTDPARPVNNQDMQRLKQLNYELAEQVETLTNQLKELQQQLNSQNTNARNTIVETLESVLANINNANEEIDASHIGEHTQVEARLNKIHQTLKLRKKKTPKNNRSAETAMTNEQLLATPIQQEEFELRSEPRMAFRTKVDDALSMYFNIQTNRLGRTLYDFICTLYDLQDCDQYLSRALTSLFPGLKQCDQSLHSRIRYLECEVTDYIHQANALINASDRDGPDYYYHQYTEEDDQLAGVGEDPTYLLQMTKKISLGIESYFDKARSRKETSWQHIPMPDENIVKAGKTHQIIQDPHVQLGELQPKRMQRAVSFREPFSKKQQKLGRFSVETSKIQQRKYSQQNQIDSPYTIS